jgi:hypothetical protein
MLTNMPWLVASSVQVVPSLFDNFVHSAMCWVLDVLQLSHSPDGNCAL